MANKTLKHICKLLTNRGIEAETRKLRFGYYYDGADHGVEVDGVWAIIDTHIHDNASDKLSYILSLAKKFKKYEFEESWSGSRYRVRIMSTEDKNKAMSATLEAELFQDAFWNHIHEFGHDAVDGAIEAGHEAIREDAYLL